MKERAMGYKTKVALVTGIIEGIFTVLRAVKPELPLPSNATPLIVGAGLTVLHAVTDIVALITGSAARK
jgi:hypothetical protein